MKLPPKILMLLLILAIFTPRLLDLDAFLAPDEKRWIANTAGFVTKLSHGQWDSLIQQPHPGLTTQWIGSSTVFFNSWTIRKLPLVTSQIILIGIIGYIFHLLWKPFGLWPTTLLVLFLALNPHLIAHTRVYAMDSLLALFLLLSLACLLLWQKNKNPRYLIYAGTSGALAFWSKLPGLIIIPFSFFIIAIEIVAQKRSPKTSLIKPITLWTIAFCVTSILVLPTLIISPLSVYGDLTEFFRSDDYTSLHTASYVYYLNALFFLSTPLHFFALLLLIPLFIIKKSFPDNPLARYHLITFLSIAALFTIMMSAGSKMGDRYVLPVFLFLDVVVALIFILLIKSPLKKIRLISTIILIIGLTTQAVNLTKLHPHYLAYVNPLTKPLLDNRRLGWGEGLDLAAHYLNQKTNAQKLTVAAVYPNEFMHVFKGTAIPIHQHDHSNVNYVVIYRNMFERGPGSWQQDVLNQYKKTTPEKTIFINGVAYAWIYQK